MIVKDLYTIIFADESKFIGGDYKHTKWNEIPNKKIKRIFYSLPDGDHLTLSGYEEYYHMIEATQDLTGKNRGVVTLRYAYLMGKVGTKVVIYKIDLETRQGTRKISKEIYDIKDQKIQELNPQGWK
jgi:hypothetical protein